MVIVAELISRPQSNTTFNSTQCKSFSYIACRLWNKLPTHVREASDLKFFGVGLPSAKKLTGYLDLDECRCNLSSS